MVHKMLPEPRKLQSADVCRDGGTYVVHYLDQVGNFFEVELPVITNTLNGRWGAIGYKPPILKIYDPKVHGQVKETKQLTWEEGIELRNKLLSLLSDDIGLGGKLRAEEMFELLILRGKLPNEP